MKVSIIYGSTTGNTERVADMIKGHLGDHEVNVVNVADVKDDDYASAELVLLGSSTWGYGELQDDFAVHFDAMSNAQLSGKKVAVFGCGDQDGFADVFCEAVTLISDKAEECGATLVAEGLRVNGDPDDNADAIETFAKSL